MTKPVKNLADSISREIDRLTLIKTRDSEEDMLYFANRGLKTYGEAVSHPNLKEFREEFKVSLYIYNKVLDNYLEWRMLDAT